MKINRDELQVGRVLYEDDDYLAIEILKHDDRPVSVSKTDRWLCLTFLRRHRFEPEAMTPFVPWQEEGDQAA